MHWYITELFHVATEIDGMPWGRDDELTLVATLSDEAQKSAEVEYSEADSVTDFDEGLRDVSEGLRDVSARLDQLMREAETTGSASVSFDDLKKINAERRAAEEAGWTPRAVEPQEDQVRRLSSAQLATARRVIAEAGEIYRRIVRVLQDQVAAQEDVRPGYTADDAYEFEEIYEPEYDEAPIGGLFDSPEELGDEEYEPGWEEDDKPFEERFSISQIEIPFDEPDSIVVCGSCDWDPEHGFELKL